MVYKKIWLSNLEKSVCDFYYIYMYSGVTILYYLLMFPDFFFYYLLFSELSLVIFLGQIC